MITSQRFMALTRPKIANARLITQIKQHPSIILLISFMNICNLIILTLLKLKKYMNLNLMCWNISSDYIIQLGNHFHSCRFSMYEQYDASIFMVILGSALINMVVYTSIFRLALMDNSKGS
ncbi:hypothetical protein BCV71DRAFT_234933 [Rhizopus microsporus]|uniref:Uncharacterized protein n=1 Tax=Rhizopus microsporus TaxID=58291 RepID=A0A1X0S2M3_RHIZD|nr:hypothetical protein BCV71DRAFT_234933 [Rhizopus microsporus]